MNELIYQFIFIGYIFAILFFNLAGQTVVRVYNQSVEQLLRRS